MCSSDVLDFENQANPDLNKQAKISEILNRAKEYATMAMKVEKRAEQLVKMSGMQPLDALHAASAEALEVDVLLTCDDQFVKAARRLKTDLKVMVLNPSEFARKESN